jgi:predicted ArsR family transcriptional regulator
MSTMGERFLLYRFDHTDADEAQQASKAIDLIGHEKEMRHALASAMKSFFQDLNIPRQPTSPNPDEKARLIALATISARCRSAVERNGHNREISLVPDHEAPGRLALTLMRLHSGLRIIGLGTDDAWTLCQKVGLDCMPRLRREVLLYLIEHAHTDCLKSSTIADDLGFPTTSVTRTLEDLAAHAIVTRKGGQQGKGHEWSISRWAFKLYLAAQT